MYTCAALSYFETVAGDHLCKVDLLVAPGGILQSVCVPDKMHSGYIALISLQGLHA